MAVERGLPKYGKACQLAAQEEYPQCADRLTLNVLTGLRRDADPQSETHQF